MNKFAKTLLTALVAATVSFSASAQDTMHDRAAALAAEHQRMINAGETAPSTTPVTTTYQQQLAAASQPSVEDVLKQQQLLAIKAAQEEMIKSCYAAGHKIEKAITPMLKTSALRHSAHLAEATDDFQEMKNAYKDMFFNGHRQAMANTNTSIYSGAPATSVVQGQYLMADGEAGVVRNIERMIEASKAEYKFDTEELTKIMAQIVAGKLNYGNVHERIAHLFNKDPSKAATYCQDWARNMTQI